ncbi:NlpC/P60 family protein [Amylibacter sp. IMCC11727]|uniref:NlpC/P60 family protein n=1 Tax=Amylibacter sp. IMCC11727 TaxID=3039851 RepID=UPI00244E1B9C|nr:NlpC/P60 family protein [Amylibacter sp. IMCC11727]WGI20829.1 NlpC/P60 family protein [Amylibacter sp. IMCC11727]
MPCNQNAKIVRVARDWIGTPYRHQRSTKGQGADCLGLLRGVWREVLGAEPEAAPSYTADWSEQSGEERLWQAAARHLRPVEVQPDRAGDVVLFRMRGTAVAKHLAILGDGRDGFPTLIHSYSGTGVVETPLTPAWARRIVAQFEFPDRRG